MRKPLRLLVKAFGVKFWFESFVLSERESTEEEIIPIGNGHSADGSIEPADGAEVALMKKDSSCILGRSPLGIRPSGREQLILFISIDSFSGQKPWFNLAVPAMVYSFRKECPCFAAVCSRCFSSMCTRKAEPSWEGSDRGWMDGVPGDASGNRMRRQRYGENRAVQHLRRCSRK